MLDTHFEPDFWNFGDHKEDPIHRIHSYPAKFPAFITTKAVQYAEENNVSIGSIGDPFCGCGTTAVEAIKLGKDYWGCDINPVATLIAKVKTGRYLDRTLQNYYIAIMNQFDMMVIDECKVSRVNDRIRYWHDEDTIADLLNLKNSIFHVIPKQSKYLKFFLCAFSNILKPTSKWLTKSIKPQIDPDKEPSEVREAFRKQFDTMRKANERTSCSMADNLSIRIDNANYLTTRRKKAVDLIITSPPYVISYDYADIHQLSLLWLDFTSDHRSLKEGMIGNQYGKEEPLKSQVRNLCSTGRNTYIDLFKHDRSKANAIFRYFIDIEKMVEKSWELLTKNGMAIFVIGKTKYKGVEIDNLSYIRECMERANFSDIRFMERDISLKIMTPYRDSAGRFTRDPDGRKVYNREFVVTGKKS